MESADSSRIEIVLGEHTYFQSWLPTREAFNVQVQLAKLVGPGAKAVIEGFLGGELGDAEQGAALAYAVTELLPGLDGEELWSLAHKFVAHTRWRNPEGLEVPLKNIFDVHFQGPKGLARLYRFVWKSLEEQLGPFLGEFGLSSLLVATHAQKPRSK